MTATIQSSKTFCRICEAACGLRVEPPKTADGPLRLLPDRDHPVSQGYVCAKGTRFSELASDPDRLLHPYVRDRAGRLVRTPWRGAMDRVASELRRIIDEHGPHAVGLYYGNPLTFNAIGALAGNMFSAALGSRNVFSAGSQDCNNKFAAGEMIHGSPALHPVPDLDHCDLAVFFGTNPAVSQCSFVHLHGGARLLDHVRDRGAKLVFVDVRDTESSQRWGESITVRPGSDVWLILALLNLVATDEAANLPHQIGLDELLAVARTVSVKKAASLTGLTQKAIKTLAKRIAETPKVALHMSVGVNMGPFGTLAYVALQALMFVTGNLDRRGGNVFNPMGPLFADVGRWFGLGSKKGRSRIGDFRPRLDSLPGGVLADEITTEGPGKIRALVCLAGDPVNSIPDSDRLNQALGELEFIVSIDMFENRTGRAADVLLPATSWLERWDVALPGLVLQHADTIQFTEAVVPAPGECRPEVQILAELSLALGRPLAGSRVLSHALARLPRNRLPKALVKNLPKLGPYGFKGQSPSPGTYLGVGPRTQKHQLRFWHSDLAGEPARLAEWEEKLSRPTDKGAPFLLVGRRRKIGHNSWVHGGVRTVRKGEDAAWLHPSDAKKLKLLEGATITIATALGSIELPVSFDDGVAKGTVVVPHGLPGVNVNRVIPSGQDMVEPVSGQHIMTGVPVSVRAA